MRALVGLAGALALAACGGDDAGFSIADLDCTPTTLVAGQQTAVACDYTFSDEDLVIDTLHLEVVHPDGVTDMLDAAFANEDMLTGGPGYVNFNLTPNSVGTATVRVSMKSGATSSNVVSFELTSVAP